MGRSNNGFHFFTSTYRGVLERGGRKRKVDSLIEISRGRQGGTHRGIQSVNGYGQTATQTSGQIDRIHSETNTQTSGQTHSTHSQVGRWTDKRADMQRDILRYY